MSTSQTPQQFLALTELRTMFQLTVLRVMDRGRFTSPLIVANAEHTDIVIRQLAEIGVTDAIIVLEPCARGTAPAIALAALAALAVAPGAIMLVMPSDHVITDEAAFHTATEALMPVVQDGWLATYGINPTGPETGYGYIQMGSEVEAGVNAVKRFVEKPDTQRAAAMMQSGNLIHADGIRVSVHGIDDLLIIANGNEVMILPRGTSQKVRDFASD